MKHSNNTQNNTHSDESAAKKPYTAPLLERFGDVRDLTLGPSPGITDSGMSGKAVGT